MPSLTTAAATTAAATTVPMVGAVVSPAAIMAFIPTLTSPDSRLSFHNTTPAITALILTAATLLVITAARRCFRATTAGKLRCVGSDRGQRQRREDLWASRFLLPEVRF